MSKLLNIGILGSGNFGGQIASLGADNGFPAIAINASEQDLRLLSDNVVPFIVGDGKGTGKNGDYAREFMLEHLALLKDETFVEFITSNDVIIMAASAGGGFGSNTVPVLTQILTEMYTDKLFIPLCVYPDEGETYTAQINTQKYMKSIIEAEVPYLVYDNDKYKRMSPNEAAKAVNANILEDLKVLRGDYVASTMIGGIEERDLLTTLSVPGRMIIDKIMPLEESSIIDGSIVATIRRHMNETAHAAIVDDKIIMASAVSYLVTPDVDKYTSAVKTDLQNVFGTHITDYRNEAVTTNSGDIPYITTILSGLNAPTTRIDKVINRTEAIDKELMSRQKASTKLGSSEGAKHTLAAKKFGNTKTTGSSTSMDDILNKYRNLNK